MFLIITFDFISGQNGTPINIAHSISTIIYWILTSSRTVTFLDVLFGPFLGLIKEQGMIVQWLSLEINGMKEEVGNGPVSGP